jgi:hypothetical protein
MVNTGKVSSVDGGAVSLPPGRAVVGEGTGMGVVGVRGVRGVAGPEWVGEEENEVEKKEGEGGGRWWLNSDWPFGDGGGNPLVVRFADVGEWLEYIRFRCVGERGGWRVELDGMWRVGGTASVAALIGGVRICSFGRLTLSRSADVVSKRRRLGTLGRLAGVGRRKARWEGGGEGSASISGGMGDFSLSRSISGRTLDRAAVSVSSWNSPALALDFLLSSWWSSDESGPSETMWARKRGCARAADKPFLR